MSFILESIKQAERERKLGQQAPSISIEYAGEHIDDVENNKSQWLVMTLGLVIAALVVWNVTQYFANKDRQYIAEISTIDSSEVLVKNEAEKRDIALKPVKILHSSDLKSVKVIAEEEITIPKPKEEIAKPVIQQQSVKTVVSENVRTKLKVVPEVLSKNLTKNVQQDKIVTANNNSDVLSKHDGKHELAEIYSDLAELTKQEVAPGKSSQLSQDVEEELVQIEVASFVAPEPVVKEAQPTETSVPSSEFKEQHAQAVRSGVPSFGELPYDIQEQIPDFNVSVHMFHKEPLQRRIRINGQMYTEGKSLQKNLALVEITRFGAIFDYRGHLFRLNVR